MKKEKSGSSFRKKLEFVIENNFYKRKKKYARL